MPYFRCHTCGKTGWSDGASCPWCGSTLLTPEAPVPPGVQTGAEIEVGRTRRRPWRRSRIIDAESHELLPPAWKRVKRTELVGALVLVIILVGVVLVETGALKLGSSPPPPPRFQQLSSAGENWSIPDTSPHVVKFVLAGTGAVWMNFTVFGGGVSVYLCNATEEIQPLTPPQGCDASGGLTTDSGTYVQYWNSTESSAELAFINFGPEAGSGATVYLLWSTPLEVVQS